MRRIPFLFLLVFGLAWSVNGQETRSAVKNEYVVIPSDIVVLVNASQPRCPIRLENAHLLMSVQRKYSAFSYDIRNTGSKPVLWWQTMALTSMGTGGTLSNDEAGQNKILLPGEVAHEDSQSIVSLTDDLKKQLNLDKYKGTMVALLVSAVGYTDGTKYQDASTEAAVRSYFEKLATNLNRLENLMKDEKKRTPPPKP